MACIPIAEGVAIGRRIVVQRLCSLEHLVMGPGCSIGHTEIHSIEEAALNCCCLV